MRIGKSTSGKNLTTTVVEHQMSIVITSRIMRTTIDIADPVLREIRALHEREGRSMGAVVSDLLADALARRRAAKRPAAPFAWVARPMQARIDLADKDALYAALDAGER